MEDFVNGWVLRIRAGDQDIFHYVNNVVHNEGAPAQVHRDGPIIYFHSGLFHRDHGPAVINKKRFVKLFYCHGNFIKSQKLHD